MFRLSMCACSTIPLVFALMLATPVAADEEFHPMFNGVDLSGWVRTNTPPQTWKFNDGMLICSGKPIGEIRTEKMYQNFILELEWRHMVPRGNAGVFVWADDITSRGVPFHRGIEVQVLENAYGNNQSHTTHGDIFPIHGATMTPINGRGGSRAFPTESRSNASPEWNHYRIECRDGSISLAVNGKVVTQGKDCVPSKGYICLESEGGVVHYRNVKIRELESSPIADDQIAIADRGYHSIYSGLDLDGWKPLNESSNWKSKDWVLAYEGAEGETGVLQSTDSYASRRFVVDVRMKNADSSVVITAGKVTIDLAQFADHREPVGRWNRIEAVHQDDTLRLEINGKVAQSGQETDLSGKLNLRATGAVDFCNVYVASK